MNSQQYIDKLINDYSPADKELFKMQLDTLATIAQKEGLEEAYNKLK